MASGDPDQPLERYRDYVLMLARIQLLRALLAKVDASDVAQETLLKAHAKRYQFWGQTNGEMMAWLRAIIANTIAEAARRFGGPQRNVTFSTGSEELPRNVNETRAGQIIPPVSPRGYTDFLPVTA